MANLFDTNRILSEVKALDREYRYERAVKEKLVSKLTFLRRDLNERAEKGLTPYSNEFVRDEIDRAFESARKSGEFEILEV